MKIYLAAPLFNEMELKRNLQICSFIEKQGFTVYLPQRDGGLLYDLIKFGYTIDKARKEIFKRDLEAIYNCEIILCLLDGRVLDEGMCVELGIAYAENKICIGYKTDYRAQDKYGHNIMIEGVLKTIHTDVTELVSDLVQIKNLQANKFPKILLSH